MRERFAERAFTDVGQQKQILRRTFADSYIVFDFDIHIRYYITLSGMPASGKSRLIYLQRISDSLTPVQAAGQLIRSVLR